MPLVADIHFDYRLAIAAIEAGADKIRINPGNIGSPDRIRAVVEAAKVREIPIRVGVNSGSLEKDILKKYGGVTAEGLAESALRNIKYIEDMDYGNLVVSIKSSDVKVNYDAHKILAEATDVPIHIGITEAGTPEKRKDQISHRAWGSSSGRHRRYHESISYSRSFGGSEVCSGNTQKFRP